MDRRLRAVALSLTALAAIAPGSVLAHDAAATRTATGELAVGALLVTVLALYVIGVRALWRSAGGGRGIVHARAAAFAAGCVVLGFALLGPLEQASARSFTAHMIQHELMMLVAAPLIVLGAPLATWAWAFASPARSSLARVTRAIGASAAWRWSTRPLVAWALHAVTLWGWHLPPAFSAAVDDIVLHDLQHASFLGSALLFWWAVLRPHARRSTGLSIMLLFTTMLHTGALGALLAFSPAPWYAPYAGTATLTALEDQQLGALVMWLPGGAVYMAAALAQMARWLRAPRTEAAGVSATARVA